MKENGLSVRSQGSLPEQSRGRTSWVVAAALLAVVFVLYAYGTYVTFTSKMPGGNDFYSRWAGAKILILEHKDPYTQEATQEIQLGMFGKLSSEGEDQAAFAYPLYVIYLIVPLIYLPYPIAQAIWQTVLQAALLVGMFAALRIHDWRPPRPVLILTCIWAILFYNSARSVLLGQFAVIVFALIAITLWAIRARSDALAGVCLFLTSIKPQMAFLLIPALLVWALVHRRWTLVTSFGATAVLLVGSSLLLVPSWIGEFYTWMARYPSYTAIGSPIWILTEYYFRFLGRPVHLILIAAALVYLAWTWRNLAAWTWPEFCWGVAMVLIVTNLIAVRTATTNYVVFLLPLAMVFKAIASQVRRGNGVIVGLELVGLVGFWAMFALTVVNKFEHPIMYLPLPLLLLGTFVLGREWVTRGQSRSDV